MVQHHGSVSLVVIIAARQSLSAVPGSLLSDIFSLTRLSITFGGVIRTGLGRGGAAIMERLHLKRGNPMPRPLQDEPPVLRQTSPMGCLAQNVLGG